MQNPNHPVAQHATAVEPTDASEPVETTRPAWHTEVGQLLQRAANLCIDHDIDVDSYLSGAWTAYVEARPGMRDQLEEAQLRQQLDELRKLGRLASA